MGIYHFIKIVALLSVAVFAKTYTTDFNGTENPLSEGGAWVHNGLDWAVVQKSGGFAYGTQTGTGGYDDSYALLTGFSPDQEITAVVHRVAGMDISCTREVELLLRWTDAAHSAAGYECLWDNGGGIQIVRWNGAIGNFTVLSPTGYGSWPPIADGDTLKAAMVGNLITMYRNGVKRADLTDNSYSTGNPGIGFFRRNCGNNSDFGYTYVTATDGSGTDGEGRIAEKPGQSPVLRNHPNPFNAGTFLWFEVPAPCHVRLKVTDITGRETAVLADGMKSAGTHVVRLNGQALASGVYWARLYAGKRIITHKMLLMR